MWTRREYLKAMFAAGATAKRGWPSARSGTIMPCQWMMLGSSSRFSK